MRTMLNYILSMSVVLGGLAVAEPGTAEHAASGDTKTTPILTATWESDTVCVYTRDVWTLKVTYLRKGTRSEGQDGQLLKAGAVVAGTKVGETKKTSLGELKYYGAERKSLWSLTGWNFSERRDVKRSSEVPAKPSVDPESARTKVKPACCGGCTAK